MSFSAVVVAAGAGLRAGPGDPKAWRPLAGRPVVRWSVEGLLAAGAAEVAVVVAAERLTSVGEALQGLANWRPVAGGSTRALSVQAGLNALTCHGGTAVLVHDA